MRAGTAFLAGCLLLAQMPIAGQGQDRARPGEPLEITVRTDKPEYKPGERVRVEVVLTNRSARPIVLAKAIHDGSPAGSVGVEGAREGRPVDLGTVKTSMPFAGVGLQPRV